MVTRVLRRRPVRDFILMTVGLVLTAWALNAFLIPNRIAAGGVSGLATVLYYLGQQYGVTVSVGAQMLAINAVLLVVGWRTRGLRYAAKTVYGAVGLAVLVDLLGRVTPSLASDDLLLAALYGGALSGIGMGLVFKAGGNTGGTDIVAQLIAPRTSLGVGQLVLIVDALVVLLAAAVFGPALALYAVVAIAVAGWVIDLVLEGISVERAVWVVSDQADRIGEAVTRELGRGATQVHATGVWTGESRGMLFIVVSRKELDALKQIVGAVDASALVIISNVHEAIGEGFKEMGTP
jgi:uncharacterized membrane-anchored protein YitT (DUF2179 family)